MGGPKFVQNNINKMVYNWLMAPYARCLVTTGIPWPLLCDTDLAASKLVRLVGKAYKKK